MTRLYRSDCDNLSVMSKRLTFSLILIVISMIWSLANAQIASEYTEEFEEEAEYIDDNIEMHFPGEYYDRDNIPDSLREEHGLFTAKQLAVMHPDTTTNWWKLLWKGKICLDDPNVHYPRFPRFCFKVYYWADKAFNSYDKDYVVGTGRKWKARVVSDNWTDGYNVNFEKKMNMKMLSDMCCNLGAYIQFMAVSVGYSVDVPSFIGRKQPDHKKFEFGFTCARFNADLYYHKNVGGTFIRHFGEYDNGGLIKENFPGLTLSRFGIDAYYFFNNKKYSEGAAYSVSKYQLKSAGSALLGFTYNNLDINFDFKQLPANLQPYLTIMPNKYRFHYNSWSIMGGYGYNWVWNKHLLYNITLTPAIGITKGYEDSLDSKGTLLSLSGICRSSITYNLRDFYFCVQAKVNGNLYNSDRYKMFDSLMTFVGFLGIRF